MLRSICLLLILSLAGCQEEAPKPKPPEPPKDHVLISPGPTDPDAPQEFTTTASGLKYRILRKSDGKKPSEDAIVRVHYRGTFDDGKIFDSTYGRLGGSSGFALKGVIKGWTEGLQLIGQGGMIELDVPPELAYGDRKRDGMPANSRLHFIIELLEIHEPAKAPEQTTEPAAHK